MKFRLKKSVNNKDYFVLVADNGEIVMLSEMYESLQGAKHGIAVIQKGFAEGDVRVASGDDDKILKPWWRDAIDAFRGR